MNTVISIIWQWTAAVAIVLAGLYASESIVAKQADVCRIMAIQCNGDK